MRAKREQRPFAQAVLPFFHWQRRYGAQIDTQMTEIGASAPCRTVSRGHVLVIDDDAATRERLADYLTLNDFRVTPVENGKRMMEILKAETVDLIALELTLRGEDGHRLARKL